MTDTLAAHLDARTMEGLYGTPIPGIFAWRCLRRSDAQPLALPRSAT